MRKWLNKAYFPRLKKALLKEKIEDDNSEKATALIENLSSKRFSDFYFGSFNRRGMSSLLSLDYSVPIYDRQTNLLKVINFALETTVYNEAHTDNKVKCLLNISERFF